MHLPDLITEGLGRLAYEFARVQPLLPTYGHLILSAIFPIFAGAFASLSRPSSAAKPEKKGKGGEEDLEDEEEEPVKMEGLSPSDAILFPVLAGLTLTGLYFLIKWLQDPALLNKILNWYFATFSVFSVSRLISDGLDVLHSFLFPHDYIDGGILYHVEPKQKRVVLKDTAILVKARTSPLPGLLSRLPLPQRLQDLFWTLHVLPTRKLTFSASAHSLGSFKLNLGIHGLEGLAVGLTTVLYYNLIDKPWYLTNLMGFGFAYGALQLMSPTTFTTGTMLLGALLCYDFYMVFRTPMMVTVAKSLDIPIKLLFPRPPEPDADPASKALSMLGLGDVVLPGIMIGLALRFDLYLHYLYKQSRSKSGDNGSEVVKAPYIPVSEAWGDRFWTTSFLPGFSRKSVAVQAYRARNVFPKPYFYAGLGGYFVGMISTLAAMQISSHPQPALIYLVPGVLVALWGTALVRGETKQMYKFSDAAEEEEKKKEDDKNSKSKAGVEVKASPPQSEAGEQEHGKEDDAGKKDKTKQDVDQKSGTKKSIFSNDRAEERSKHLEKYFSTGDTSSEKTAAKSSRTQQARTLFSFSITAPPPYWPDEDSKPAALKEDGKAAKEEVKDVSATPVKSGEHIEKRRRIA